MIDVANFGPMHFGGHALGFMKEMGNGASAYLLACCCDFVNQQETMMTIISI